MRIIIAFVVLILEKIRAFDSNIADTSDFKTLVLNDLFVDKSLFIKKFLQGQSGYTSYLTAWPKRWGKSVTVNMAQRFFDVEVDQDGNSLPNEKKINRKLFCGGDVTSETNQTVHLQPLKIASDVFAMRFQGNFPVVMISFKNARGSNLSEAIDGINHEVSNLFKKFEYLKYLGTEEKKVTKPPNKGKGGKKAKEFKGKQANKTAGAITSLNQGINEIFTTSQTKQTAEKMSEIKLDGTTETNIKFTTKVNTTLNQERNEISTFQTEQTEKSEKATEIKLFQVNETITKTTATSMEQEKPKLFISSPKQTRETTKNNAAKKQKQRQQQQSKKQPKLLKEVISSTEMDQYRILRYEQTQFEMHLQEQPIDDVSLTTSLRLLTKFLFAHFNKKVIVLIDDYDVPLINAYNEFKNQSEIKEFVYFIEGLFSWTFRESPFVERVLLAGIVKIELINKLRSHSLLDEEFSGYFGFDQEEVDKLLTQIPTQTDVKKLEKWYGYDFGERVLYNPGSIMRFLTHEGRFEYYWLKWPNDDSEVLDRILLSDDMQVYLQRLISGHSIVYFANFTKAANLKRLMHINKHHIMFFAGCLNPVSQKSEKQEGFYELTIPNLEVKHMLETRVTRWVADKLNIDISQYNSLNELLLFDELQEFKETMQRYMLNVASFIEDNERNAKLLYTALIIGLRNSFSSSHEISCKFESGWHGMILIPKKNRSHVAIFLEYKIAGKEDELESVAQNAFEHISKPHFQERIQNYPHISKVVKLAIAFNGTKIAMKFNEPIKLNNL